MCEVQLIYPTLPGPLLLGPSRSDGKSSCVVVLLMSCYERIGFFTLHFPAQRKGGCEILRGRHVTQLLASRFPSTIGCWMPQSVGHPPIRSTSLPTRRDGRKEAWFHCVIWSAITGAAHGPSLISDGLCRGNAHQKCGGTLSHPRLKNPTLRTGLGPWITIHQSAYESRVNRKIRKLSRVSQG